MTNNDQEIHSYYDLANDLIKDRLERVNGISEVRVYGGAKQEMQVIINPESLAQYKLTIPDVVNALAKCKCVCISRCCR